MFDLFMYLICFLFEYYYVVLFVVLACNKNINKRICKHSLMIYFRLFGFDRVFGGKTIYFETGVSYSPCR